MAGRFIVMGDIVKSSAYDGKEMMRGFKGLVSSCNRDLSEGILSPYTITLGDEFQGVARSLSWSVRSLVYLEESRLRRKLPYSLHYVVHYGRIDTPLNRWEAYGMVGPGLTHARELLVDRRRGRPAFVFDLPDERLASQLTRLFWVMSSLQRGWKMKDVDLILEMLASDHDAEIAARHGKNRSQIWKRRKNLRIDEFRALRDIVLELSNGG